MGLRRDGPSFRDARQTARHVVESWALEATQQRNLANEYRDHVRWLSGELRSLQHAAGLEQHWCPTCVQAATVVGEGGEAR